MPRNRLVPYSVKIVQSGRSHVYESIKNIVQLDTLTGHPTGGSQVQVLLLEAYKTTTFPTTPAETEAHRLYTPSPSPHNNSGKSNQPQNETPPPPPFRSPSPRPHNTPPILPPPPNNTHTPLPNNLPPRNNKHHPDPRHLLHLQPPLQRDLPPPTDPRQHRRRHMERVPTGRRRHGNPPGACAVPVHFGAAGADGVGWVSVAVVVWWRGWGGEVSLSTFLGVVWAGGCWWRRLIGGWDRVLFDATVRGDVVGEVCETRDGADGVTQVCRVPGEVVLDVANMNWGPESKAVGWMK